MIKTERQYATTRAQLEQLVRALREDTAEPPRAEVRTAGPAPDVDPRFLALAREALKSQIADLEEELDEYDALRTAGAVAITVSTLEELPRALIRARIVRRWTQGELAERLGVAEQQVQRYEATEYESASFARLKEIARALDVEVPGAILDRGSAVSPEVFFRRLDEVGFDREVVLEKVLPADISVTVRAIAPRAPTRGRSKKRAGSQEPAPVDVSPDEVRAAIARAGSVVSRVLGVNPASFFSAAPLRLEPAVVGAHRFKQTAGQASRTKNERLRGDQAAADAYTVYAHYLALVLLEAHRHTPAREVPDDSREVRRLLTEAYRSRGGLSLEGALHLAWDLGIPVLPLSDSGRFHGACWRVAGRNVIVLKQRTRSFARWLFDLLHELRHAGQHPGAEDFAVVERNEGKSLEGDVDDEQDAMQFAGDVLLDGRAEDITERAVSAAGGSVERLKAVVPQLAEREGVAVDALANYLAHRLALDGFNWWGAAHNLQRTDANPFSVARDVLLQRADLSRLNSLDRELLLGALRGSES